MDKQNNNIINEIRRFNRFYTDILGLLNKHILDSPYSLTEVRILLEIDRARNCTANMLMDKLNVDRGYMSRILKHFEASGLVSKESSTADRRAVFLYLTPKGKDTISALEERSIKQVQGLISHLTEDEQEKLIKSMQYISSAISHEASAVVVRIYQPKDIDYIIKRHRELYTKEHGFGKEFGDYVEKYMLKFNESHDENRENIWIAEADGKIVGVIAIVKADDATAQLRWFLIEPEMRGKGLGHRLMQTALDFCKEKYYKHVFLWTVSSLVTARHLYKSYGFELTETMPNDSWANNLTEERWDLELE